MATAQQTAKRKFTTIAALEETERGQVWALNVSGADGGESGPVIFNAPKLNGNGGDVVRVLKSFIPMDLTLQVPKNQLMNSSEFRRTVQKGLIKLCTPEYAEALLKSEDGKEEMNRITNQLSAVRVAENNSSVTEDDETFDPADLEGGEDKTRIKNEREQKTQRSLEGSVSIKLQTLANTALADNVPPVRVVNLLRNHGKMTKEELLFLRSKFSAQPKVIKFLKEQYDKLKS